MPYPPRGGSRQRSFNLIRNISQKYETHLIALNMQGESEDRAAEYTAELKKHCAEVEIWQPPYSWRGARWWAQLAVSPLLQQHYAANALWSPLLDGRWRTVLHEHPGALLHFDSIDLARYVPAAVDFKKVLNHHNCESAMAARRATKESNPLARAYLWHQSRKLCCLEERLCHQFEVNLVVSQLDAQTLLRRDPQAHIHVVENSTDTEYFHPSDALPEPNTLVFAGGLSWYPNVSGIRFFTREIWPLLKQQYPDIRLYLAGSRPAPSIVGLAESDPTVVLVSDPEDIRPWVARAAVFICPIIDGGGTRLKLLDAMAMGKAIVSTSIGGEGLKVKHEENILIADTPRAIASEIGRALESSSLRKHLGEAGRALVEKEYSCEVVGRKLEGAYRCAIAGGSCGGQPGTSHPVVD